MVLQQASNQLNIIIMAAGQGNRMHSNKPKVLHQLGGQALLTYVLNTARALTQKIHVVYGYGKEAVQAEFSQHEFNWVYQEQQLGTGHAVIQVMPHLKDDERVLILNGDVPLISLTTLQKLIQEVPTNHLGLLVYEYPDASGLGRIIRNQHKQVIGIIEEADATYAQKQIREAYTGIMLASVAQLRHWLNECSSNNAQGEYYLTEVVKIAVESQVPITTVAAQTVYEVQGVNTRAQLATLERCLQKQNAEKILAQGVSLLDPARFDLRGELTVEPEITIDCNVIFEGNVSIGAGSSIGPYCLIRNATIGKNVTIKSHCVLDGAMIADNCVIGPFARLRPGTQLAEDVKIGNFVETKKANVGVGSKIPHLSYVGDAIIGTDVNIGAGTITCNYDGVDKHQTIIEDNAFIGSNSQLVAPVKIGTAATVGAGTTVRTNVPAHALAISDAHQKHIENWPRKKKKEKER